MIVDSPERFEKAIERAVERDFEAKLDYRWTHHEAGHTEMFWQAASSSTPGKEYGTRIFVEAGEIRVTCSCEAGAFGQHPCWHMAGALMLAGFLATPDPDRPSEDEQRTYEKTAMVEIHAELDQMYARDAWEAVHDAMPAVPF